MFFVKYITAILLALSLAFAAPVLAFADFNAAFSGPTQVRAGDRINVVFFVGEDAEGGSGRIVYDDKKLTLVECRQIENGDYRAEFVSDHFIFYRLSEGYSATGVTPAFSLVFDVSEQIAVGSSISVKVTDLVFTDGVSDYSQKQVTYSTTILEQMSEDAALRSLSVDGLTLYPAFSPELTEYEATLPAGKKSVTVSAKARSNKAKVSVSGNKFGENDPATVSIKVTAESGDVITYTIRVAREQSSDATLSFLSVDEYELIPSFSPEVFEYSVSVSKSPTELGITFRTTSLKADAVIGEITDVEAGGQTDVEITVTAEDGTSAVYLLKLTREAEPQTTDPVTDDTSTADTETTRPVQTDAATTDAFEPTVGSETGDGELVLIVGASVAVCAIFSVILLLTTQNGKKKKNENAE